LSEKKPTIKEPLATIGDRIIAYIIDFFITQAPVLIGGVVIGIAMGIVAIIDSTDVDLRDEAYTTTAAVLGIITLLAWIVFSIYYVIFWTARHEGQSIGKKFKKIRIMVVEDLESGKIRRMTKDDVGITLMRLIFSIIDALFFFLLGIYIMNNDPNNQRFADQQAKTVVILEKE